SQKTAANIPFEFIVGDATMQAGRYTVSAITGAGDTLRIRSTTGRDSAVRLTSVASGKSREAKLVFHKYGQRYFLAEVWSAQNDGRELNKSRQEKATEKEMARIAALKHEPKGKQYETIEVLASLQ